MSATSPTSARAADQPLAHLFAHAQGFKIPPLQHWQPRQTMDLNLRIAANGQWYHQATLIKRHRLVKLFASLLRREADGAHYLVTPRLKYPVTVEDAPFQAVELKRQWVGAQQNLIFRTNMDDVVLADRAHPIRVQIAAASAQPSPYVEVRDGLQAKICRSVYYELSHLLESADAQSVPDERAAHEIVGVRSAGQFFLFGRC